MTLFDRDLFQLLVGGAVAVIAVSHVAGAQTAPAGSVRIIVPCAVGTPSDVTARILAKKMSEIPGQQVYVENLMAGTGPIDMNLVNKLLADGRSMLFNLGDCGE